MDNYKRWIYILNDDSKYDMIKDNELYYDPVNKILYIKALGGYDIPITDERIYDHINDYNNPHFITKDDLGLSKIPNCRLASINEMESHTNNINNPHNITKYQVDLSNVKNYDFADDDDIKNRADDKYISPKQVKDIVDDYLSDYIDKNKVKILVTSNAENYLLSLRKIGTMIWRDGNFQVVEKGSYEYKLTAPGYYSKLGKIDILNDKNIYIELEKIDSVILDRIKLDGSLELAIAINNSGGVHVWGNDIYEGVTGSSNIGSVSARHVFAFIDVYTVILDDGSLYQWGSGIDKYRFLKMIPKDKKYKYFIMNSEACALLDENNNLYCYGEEGFVNSAPKITKFKQIHCNRNMFIGITNGGSLVGWGNDNNNMLNDIPLGIFKYVSLTDLDIVAIRESGYVCKWGKDDLLKQKDLPLNEVFKIDIYGNSIASISTGGELKLGGKIKNNVPESALLGTYTNCKLIDQDTIILTSTDKSLSIYPKSTSILYTSKPTQKIF